MTKDEFTALYEKCLSGQCSEEELRLLETYQDDYELKKYPWQPEMGDKDEVRVQIILNLRKQVQSNKRLVGRIMLRLSIAASVIVLLSAGVIFFIQNKKEATLSSELSRTPALSSISPGSNKATLILDNGEQIDLDGSGEGLISQQGSAAVNKLSDGQLIYRADKAVDNENLTYNTIATPRGGQYQLTLSDGTKVWLNAASSLKYPTVFLGRERIVELTGEAYFEVSENKAMPFKVVADGVSVNVLGTHFNVMSYGDENSIQTTLLEGSVQLKKDDLETMLSPGQQGQFSKGAKSFRVKEVKVNNIVSWKDGLFTFDDENIHSIMRRISRWYDVDIAFQGNLARQNFGGSVSRFKDISYLLKTLELTGTIHFKIEGRRIIVMP